MQEIVKKAGELLGGCETISLASVSEEGYPRICVLSRIRNEGIRTIWVSTGANSVKTTHFRRDPKAGVCFTSGGDSVTLLGKVAIVTDEALKRELWQDWFIEHFPGGPDDPDYCVLRFDAEEATIWIDGVFETHRVAGDAR